MQFSFPPFSHFLSYTRLKQDQKRCDFVTQDGCFSFAICFRFFVVVLVAVIDAIKTKICWWQRLLCVSYNAFIFDPSSSPNSCGAHLKLKQATKKILHVLVKQECFSLSSALKFQFILYCKTFHVSCRLGTWFFFFFLGF